MSSKFQTLVRCREFAHGLLLSFGFLPAVWSGTAAANLSGAAMADYTSTPIATVESVTPLVMLTMSMDHQYWFKAYNDYTDLDNDGVVERTYDDTFEYYGYFHAERCYTFDDGTKTFSAAGVATGTNSHHCTGSLDGAWSGNFLNWATMTRMDVVRKILYGGYRSTDTSTATVLQRTHLPGDAHSFAKYYNGADIKDLTPFNSVRTDTTDGGDSDGFDDVSEGMTICNTTYQSSGSSQGATALPMMRVVSGNRQLWAANERRQCTWDNENGDNGNSNTVASSGIDADSSDPPSGAQLQTPGGSRDHIVQVKVCESTYFDSERNLENCRVYGSNLKPEGLLQRYGLNGQIHFGLITGTYQKNISGGVLRKKIGSMTDEVSTANGTFLAGAPGSPGIIKTLNAVRVWGYGYNNGTYRSDDSGGDDCTFQLTDITTEGKCASWGNPMSEVYLESLRYFALSGTRAPTSAFNADDSTYITGLTKDSWTADPLTSDNACAALNNLVFNASVSSYDDNATTGFAPLSDVITRTNVVGDGEGITGNNFFVGRSGTATNEFCSAKTVNQLGETYGLCPEAPTVRGSFHMAGMAHWARTNDIRADLEGAQTVKTFAVSLATSTPVIEIPVSATRTVRVLPAYRLRKGGNSLTEALNDPTKDGGGALVDFKIVRPHTEVSATDSAIPASGTGIFSGKFYINWEDSEQGGDYDQDMWGTLEYRLDTTVSPAQLRVTTTAVAQSTSIGQLFGFVISGSTKDGFHAYSGIQGANFTDASGVLGCNNCRALSESGGQRGAQSYTFDVSATPSADLLESPLYYAAKWGGFDDSDDDDTPNVQSEWDSRDTDGNEVAGGDGIPDNFYFVTNPGALEASLTTIFNRILERVASGTAASVLANSQLGTGALFQALYDAVKSDATAASNEVEWIGTLHALWVDANGFVREDSHTEGTRGTLDDYQTDKVVNLFFDEEDRQTKLRRFDSAKPDEFVEDGSTVANLNELETLWNARERLADLDQTTVDTQRAYDESAAAGRYVLTWIDTDTDSAVDDGEVIGFAADAIDSTNFRWLDADTETDAERLVSWTRGKDDGLDEFRKRKVDYDGDGSTVTENGFDEIMRLGDIVNSSPVAVAAPSANYDVTAFDDTYRDFRAKYRNRRQMVYVGANDGMIHAFNSGFFNIEDNAFDLSRDGEVEHPLGAEVWAYVPKNLLPQLQWAARKDYSHVYYMDLGMRAFEAKIFADDGDHPNGWGTILVAGMRFGGGTDDTGIVIDTGGDGVGPADADGDTRDDVKTKSSYVLLDVTNPEVPPRVLAEISPPNLHLTTSLPQVVGVRDADNTGENEWYLVFGTGPSDLGSASYGSGDPATRFAQLFVYDLKKLAEGADDAAPEEINGRARTFDLDEENVFIGDIAASDFNQNIKAEALYFGTVGQPSDSTTVNHGTLYRLSLGEKTVGDWAAAPFPLLTGADVDKPFTARPAITSDSLLNRWIVVGTGRFLVNADKSTDRTEAMYGIIDPNADLSLDTTSAASDADLIDVTNARVFSNGDVSLDGDTTAETTLSALEADIREAGGWRFDLANTTARPAERSLNQATLVAGGTVLTNVFTPNENLCGAEGDSQLLGFNFKTGTAYGIFGTEACSGCPDGVTESIKAPESGKSEGQASAVVVVGTGGTSAGRTTGAEGTGGAISQTSFGAITQQSFKIGGALKNGEISWREHRGEE